MDLVLKKSMRTIFIFFCVLVVIELVLRIVFFFNYSFISYKLNKNYYDFKGSYWEYMVFYRKFAQQKNKNDDMLFIIDDYLNRKYYIPDVDLNFDDCRFKTNSFGMNEKDISLQKDEGTYRIICLGSSYSLAGGIGNRFTDMLEKRLKAITSGRKIEVINAGISGGQIFNSFMSFAFDWRKLDPDMLIIDNVLDDKSLAFAPFYFKNYKKSNKTAFYKNNVRWRNLTSNIAILKAIDLIMFLGREKLNGPPPEALDFYESTLEAMVLMGKGMDCEVVLLSCGITVDEDHNFSKDNPLYKRIQLHDVRFTVQGIVRTIAAYNDIMEKVAQKHNVYFFDLSNTVPKSLDYFVDPTHRSRKGNEIFTEELIDNFKKSGLIDEIS